VHSNHLLQLVERHESVGVQEVRGGFGDSDGGGGGGHLVVRLRSLLLVQQTHELSGRHPQLIVVSAHVATVVLKNLKQN